MNECLFRVFYYLLHILDCLGISFLYSEILATLKQVHDLTSWLVNVSGFAL